MVFAYFYIAFNDGLFQGMSVGFMEVVGNALFLMTLALLIPIVIFFENKKTKKLILCLLAFIPVMFGTLFVQGSIPTKEAVRVVSSEDENKYVLVEGLNVAKEAVKLANDDNVKNKEKIDSVVEDLIKLEEE